MEKYARLKRFQITVHLIPEAAQDQILRDGRRTLENVNPKSKDIEHFQTEKVIYCPPVFQ